MSPVVILLSPTPLDAPRGNAVTVARIARGLRARGVDARVWPVPAAAAAAALASEAARIRPALVHAFHARHAGSVGRALASAAGAPLLITLTGTDVNEDLRDPAHERLVRETLRAAAAVTAFHESVVAALGAEGPPLRDRLTVVPQSVCFEGAGSASATVPAISGEPCLLFPAGIRAVKRPRVPLTALDGLARRRPATRLWYAGPVLEPVEHDRLLDGLATRPWARHLGAVPHADMPALLAAADVVLNCSRSEGGMANAVLEALALGRAVLASDIPGNRSLIEPGITGLLWGSEAELAEGAERLAADPALRRRLGEAGRGLVAARFTPAIETEGYLSVYARIWAHGR
jgi:glycosyltransferase involved in cell wall biosynthesis